MRTKDGRELPLGSYQLFQRCALLDEGVWWKMMRGGVDFTRVRLYVLDGAKALQAAVKKVVAPPL